METPTLIKPYYQTDNSILYQNNCISIMNQLDACSIDAVLTDPPYFLSNGGITVSNGKMVMNQKGSWDQSSGFKKDVEFNRSWLIAVKRVLKPGGNIMITGSHHNIHIVGYLLQELGFKIHNTITWVKMASPPNLACKTLTHKHEMIIWASKLGKNTFNYKLLKDGDFPEDKFKNPGKQMIDVWDIGRPKKEELIYGKHPTQKPLSLFQRMVLMTTNEGDTILDPFCGSGVTCVAAAKNNRKSIGIDKDEFDSTLSKESGKYLNIAIKRLEDIK